MWLKLLGRVFKCGISCFIGCVLVMGLLRRDERM